MTAGGYRELGVKRFITVSAVDVHDRSNPAPDWCDGTKELMEAKLAADKELEIGNERRRLDYTIIRPSGLGNDSGTGQVSAGKVQLAKVIKPGDLTRVVVQCMEEPGAIGLAFDVAAGEQPNHQ